MMMRNMRDPDFRGDGGIYRYVSRNSKYPSLWLVVLVVALLLYQHSYRYSVYAYTGACVYWYIYSLQMILLEYSFVVNDTTTGSVSIVLLLLDW